MLMSKRRKAEHAAQIAELRSVLDAVHRSQAVIEFDLDGTIRTANDNFLSTVGYRLEDIQGRHHRMFMDPAEAAGPAYADFWRRLNAGEFFADTFTRYGQGGRRVVIEASYNPILNADGKPYKVIKFATDVTAATIERERRAEADQAAAELQTLVVAETGRGLSALAGGDLSHRITVDLPGQYAQLRADFNAAMGQLEGDIGVINTKAGAIRAGAGEISHASDDLSRRTERQAATLEETAAALDEVTATVKLMADNAKRAYGVVGQARQDAEASGEVVGRTVAAMTAIEQSSTQINQIIGVIDEIAFQTNLLALNAGVEAARAGEAGRGFAVVASEVRALAQRSAEAAKEIKALISESANQVRSGVSLVGETGQALTAIVSRISEISGLMTEINASTQEQATALAEVNTAVNQMDQVTQQNAAMVEEATAASHSLTQEAQGLAQLVGRFQLSGGAAADMSPVHQAQARVLAFARG
ncbi:methyl-accepting chemotaxis protein [Brevundimonas sp. PAMC22021]|uniref:methyl-accepting chemotaxis protein n=1 Tax=Brevundimonas sp. PAMC22021 TaxID=2861285 RepID=UPI001C63673D|nr:methyl-accepting chemotaxis protein [Brevundimonas sp. PAMC22021]QYF86051.1 PAS domain-containing protein [Brevundimonas sp. PAMC22021]